eukprot:9822339-Karenia_brevis.AAC.1
MSPPKTGAWSHLPRPDLIIQEAFSDGPDRIVLQLAAVTQLSTQRVRGLLREAGAVKDSEVTSR